MSVAPLQTPFEALVKALRACDHASAGAARPAAILWTDPARQWSALRSLLLAELPELVMLGWRCPSKIDPLDQSNLTRPERWVPPALRAWIEREVSPGQVVGGLQWQGRQALPWPPGGGAKAPSPFERVSRRRSSCSALLRPGLLAASAPTGPSLIYPPSKPCVENFNVRLFSVTVRTTISGAPSGLSASTSSVTRTFAPTRPERWESTSSAMRLASCPTRVESNSTLPWKRFGLAGPVLVDPPSSSVSVVAAVPPPPPFGSVVVEVVDVPAVAPAAAASSSNCFRATSGRTRGHLCQLSLCQGEGRVRPVNVASRPAVPRWLRWSRTASSPSLEAAMTVTLSNRKKFPDHYRYVGGPPSKRLQLLEVLPGLREHTGEALSTEAPRR